MTDFHERTRPKARKTHRCDGCRLDIEPGEVELETYIDDGLDRLLVACSLRQEWAELLTSNWWELLLCPIWPTPRPFAESAGQ